ncbi:MAG: tetratricopeptide repeat protein [Candidatus Omnitrophica bacterium]|nr:tetratricopeptide repeat protein [Candidatus Omnitrophota bacterium]
MVQIMSRLNHSKRAWIMLAGLVVALLLIVGHEASQSAGVILKDRAVPQKALAASAAPVYQQALEAEAKGDLKNANALLEQVISNDPANADAYFHLGVVNFKLGLKARSEEYYLKAIAGGLKNPESYFHLGYIKETEGSLQEALEYYLKAEEGGVGSAELYFNIGNVFARLGNNTRAIQYYTRAVSVNPEHLDAFVNLSTVSFQAGAYADAQFYLDKAQKLGYKAPDEYVKVLKEKQ